MTERSDLTRWHTWAIVLLIAIVFFGYLVPGKVFYGGDTARLYLPLQRAVSSALERGDLPWWSPDMGAGYPLIAEGETAGLYPLNLTLHTLFSPEIVITVTVLLHLFLAGLGTAWLSQTIGLSREAGLLTAIVYALGGFSIAHTSHVSIITVSAWLPWLLLLLHRTLEAPTPGKRAVYAAGLAAVTALQFLAGHAQMSLLILLPALGWAAWLAVAGGRNKLRGHRLLVAALAVLLGTTLAAPQLLATLELANLSQRAGGLDSQFFTSYSFHPLLTATFVSPFLLGNPYPDGSVELMGYVGLAPLALSWIAVRRGRLPIRWLLIALGLVGLLLAFGRWNPLYSLLEYVPPFNLFRVPARYLLWTSLSLALLTGMGFDQLSISRLARRRSGAFLAALCVAPALGAIAWVMHAADIDALVSVWKWLPLMHATALAAWLLGARLQPPGARLRTAVVILCADLFTYGAVLNATYTQAWRLENVLQPPAVLDLLHSDQSLYRVWTKEDILPALSVQREALYPNTAATHGVSGANLYAPLVPRAYQHYVNGMDAKRLDRLNVKYYVIPQLLPIDQASELYDVLNPYFALPYNVSHAIAVHDVIQLQVESYVSHGAELADGALAARLVLETEAGDTLEYPLRVGIETAEWAIERSDVAEVIQHTVAPLASTFPASSSYRNVEHPGHTYLATWGLSTPTDLISMEIVPVLPDAFVRVERIRFVTRTGEEILASHLLGLGDFGLVYRSEDALVYENHDVWPRAYTVPSDRATPEQGGYALAANLDASMLGAVQVIAYEPQRVELRADVSDPSLLVLADMVYPNWVADVDGLKTKIETVDGLFRGVALEPGEHRIVFAYRP